MEDALGRTERTFNLATGWGLPVLWRTSRSRDIEDPRVLRRRKKRDMQGSRVVAVEKSGRAWVFDSAEAMVQSCDDRVTHSGEEVDADWIDKQLSSGTIEWLRLDGMTFEKVFRAWKIEPWK